MAHVHCVIVGFSVAGVETVCTPSLPTKCIYNPDGTIETAKNINAYLLDGPNVFVESRNKPICNVSAMVYGNKPTEGGFLIVEEKDYYGFITLEPNAKKYIKQFIGAEEFLHNKKRYCLWLKDANPMEISKMPLVMERVKAVRDFRLKSKKAATNKKANTPTLFDEIRQPDTNYLIVPRHSSEKRKYIPIGFMDKDVIVGDANQIIPNATLYEFGILTSIIHNAWMRVVAGRLESRYRYSKDIVYNNFPWPDATEEQKAKIEATAQAILDARALYPESSLADLYDELTMPAELRKAHQENDRAVMQAYGFPVKSTFTESQCVAELFKRYQELVIGD
jgi:hypothetical protein